MLETNINPGLAHQELLTVFLLAVNRLAYLRLELGSTLRPDDRASILRRQKDLHATCRALQRLAFPDLEQTG